MESSLLIIIAYIIKYYYYTIYVVILNSRVSRTVFYILYAQRFKTFCAFFYIRSPMRETLS